MANKQIIEARRAKVAVFLLGGVTYNEMAGRLNVSLRTIKGDIRALKDQWKAEQQDAKDQYTIDMKRLEELIRAVWTSASRGHLNSVETILKIIDRRAKMYGYDALESELAKQLKARNPQGEAEELDDDVLMQIAAGALR